MPVQGISKIQCDECGTKKKMLRFTSLCGKTICLDCNSIHPNSCQECKNQIKNRIEVKTKQINGANTARTLYD